MDILFDCYPTSDLHIIPIANIITRACLAPCFLDGKSNHHTIPYRLRSLESRHFEGGQTDTAAHIGKGSKLYELNPYAMTLAGRRTGSALSFVVARMIALNIYSVLLLACGNVLCMAVGGQSQSQIRRLLGSVLAIWERLWNCAIGALGRPSRWSAAESSRQSVVCRPLVSG